jgi:hypothetical protein
VAVIPKVKVKPEHSAIFAIAVAVIGLLIIPVLTLPAMLITGVAWKAGKAWARITLVGGAVLILVIVVAGKHAAVHHHG